MSTHQQALIVCTDAHQSARGLDELNVKLRRGWRVVHAAPMGGASTGCGDPDEESAALCLAALVVIEREDDDTAAVMEQVEEEAEEFVDEIVEGNGADLPADPKLPDELEEERNGGTP